MGQAKKRGTFEQRKQAAEERDRHQRMVKAQLAQRLPSPKHVALMGALGPASELSTEKKA